MCRCAAQGVLSLSLYEIGALSFAFSPWVATRYLLAPPPEVGEGEGYTVGGCFSSSHPLGHCYESLYSGSFLLLFNEQRQFLAGEGSELHW